MKTLYEFAEKYGLQVVKISYRAQGIRVKRKGYDIIKPDTREILASFEPCEYSNGDKWYLRHVHHNYIGARYFKRISQSILRAINPNETSFIRLS